MKVKGLVLTLAVTAALLAGCGQQPAANNEANSSAAATATAATAASASTATETAASASTQPDAVTSASIVDNEAAFETAISKDGKWIIATLKDLTFDKELVLDGEFKNGKKDDKGNDVIQRKIALYTQDENRKVTARFTLTAPKITINSPEASIQHGIFKGDIYVAGKDFKLVDQTVEGNIYFLNDEAKSTFTMDDKSKVTGVQELKK
jgi:hypothetical protein